MAATGQTFALPDLRGRNIIGASAADPIGTIVGHDNVTLTNVQTPNGPGPAAAPFHNRQPSLAMEYLIALKGIFPSQPPPSGLPDRTTPFLGQIVSFAGTFVPGGWALCDGSLLQINQNQALFALLGTLYGGNGQTTFALPDLRDKTVIGTSIGVPVGTMVGANSVTSCLPFPFPCRALAARRSRQVNSAGGRRLARCRAPAAIRSPGRTAPPISTSCGTPTAAATSCRKAP